MTAFGRPIPALILLAAWPGSLAGAARTGGPADTTTYRDAATATLVGAARARHALQDSLVRDYQATVRTRIEASVGRSRFARAFPLVAHETSARLTWRAPNDLKVQTEGIRAASAFSGVQARVWLDRPWFIPRSLGDRIRLMGTPETAALHPLAPGAEEFYRFAITDSVTLEVPGRTVRAVAVRVEPKKPAPALVAGDMWLDADGGDLVRLTVLFIGEYLWERPDSATARDSARARRDNRTAMRFLSVEADLEYGLHEAKYWMPYRQLLKLTVEIPLFINATVPVQALTTFRSYRINTDPPLVFRVALADSARARREPWAERWEGCAGADSSAACARAYRAEGFRRAARWRGGRWELESPPVDSLLRFQWPDHLALAPDPADEERIQLAVARLAELAERLPAQWVGRQRAGLAFERFGDLYRFNRVQGSSVGLGYAVRPGPRFTTVVAQARFGFSDSRPTGSLTWRRDAPAGRLDVRVGRDVREVEPWTSGQGFGNSLNALLAGHDDADYYLALGGGLSYHGYAGRAAEFAIDARFERQRAMAALARSVLHDAFGGDGRFDANPSIVEGDFLRLSVTQRAPARRLDLRVGGELLAGEGDLAARLWGSARVPVLVAGRRGALTLRAGGVAGAEFPQFRFRLGGPETVRGYRYGERIGDAFWSAQLDVPVRRSGFLTPVVFADVGGVGAGGEPLVGIGAGLSVLDGLMRLNFAKGVSPDAKMRFDLLFRAPR